jgi:hypothetical protein
LSRSVDATELNVKILTLREAESSRDIDIKMMATRASRYRVFGSPERIPDAELAVVDLRDSNESEDFASQFKILDRHPMRNICLVQKLNVQP